jgi:hypothetical protein
VHWKGFDLRVSLLHGRGVAIAVVERAEPDVPAVEEADED